LDFYSFYYDNKQNSFLVNTQFESLH